MPNENRTLIVRVALALAVLLLAGPAVPQGIQTGVLTGVVKSPDNAELPGVTVTAKSPALLGERAVVTDASGAYILRGLPPGRYTLTFSLSGFATLERRADVALGATAVVDAAMTVATLEETVTVEAVAPSVLTTTQVGANYRGADIDKLATGRTLAAIAELAPGLTDNTPNTGQVTISGAFAFDNVFLLNGVDVNDNLFGTAHNLFIEDAVQETAVLTSGISAEYGRFSGGVINTITKRGGNKLSGSFRTDFTNPSWIAETPLQKERNQTNTDLTSRIYQTTLGGPIVKDRLWFFGAYRKESSSEARTFPNTSIPYTFKVDNPRYEIKLTGSPATNHTLQATYMNNDTDQSGRPAFAFSIDPRTLVNRTLPNSLLVANYTGVLGSNVFVEAQYSQKKFGFRGTGGTSTDIVDSPFRAAGRAGIPRGQHYNAPYFSSLDPENRNNKQFSGSLSYFLSGGSLGRHDLKGGFEHYISTRTGGNSQSATGFVFWSDPVTSGGVPVLDSRGRLTPVFVPGVSFVQNWISTQGAQIDIKTTSLYVNDKWTLDDRWSFNVGLRYEKVKSEATGDIVGADTSTFVPRLGATFDVNGDGRFKLYATYAHYAGKYSETQFGDNTPVGTPSLVQGTYTGPAGQGLDFAPGFNINNYPTTTGSFPLENVFFEDGLSAPVTKELTFAAGTRLGSKGEVKVVYTQRKVTNFLDDFITRENGRTTVVRDGRTFGTFDNTVVRNTDEPKRQYKGIQVQSTYRPGDRWTVTAHYTLQLENDGTFEGEATNQPGNYSLIGDYPDVFVLARNNPDGRLNDFQRHKVRAWTNYNLGLGRAGNVDLGLLYRFNSATTYSLSVGSVPLSALQRARAAGYANVPGGGFQTVYFGERGSQFFNGSHLFDFALTYELPVWRTARPWFKGEVRNLFNAHPLIGFDTTITANLTGALDGDGIPTTFTRGPNFGRATINPAPGVVGHYPLPREYRFSVGFRF
jgi:outer membrane receptor protein involved in Fe transport